MLLAVGVWLQQMGCSSPQSFQLVENIIRDHFYLNTTNQSALKSLANTAPQFVSNFITAVTELYLQDTQNPIKLPPKNLLEVITSWVSYKIQHYAMSVVAFYRDVVDICGLQIRFTVCKQIHRCRHLHYIKKLENTEKKDLIYRSIK